MPAHSRGNMLSIELKLPNKRIIDINLPEKSKVTDIYAIAEEATGLSFPAKDCSLFWKGSRMGHNMTLDYYRISNRGKVDLIRKMKTGYDDESTKKVTNRVNYPPSHAINPIEVAKAHQRRRRRDGTDGDEPADLIPDNIHIPNTPAGNLAVAEGRVGGGGGPLEGNHFGYGLADGHDGFSHGAGGVGGAARRNPYVDYGPSFVDDRIDIPATLSRPTSGGGAGRIGSGGGHIPPYPQQGDVPPTPAYYNGGADVSLQHGAGRIPSLYRPTYGAGYGADYLGVGGATAAAGIGAPGASFINNYRYSDPLNTTAAPMPLPLRYAGTSAAAAAAGGIGGGGGGIYDAHNFDPTNASKAISPKRNNRPPSAVGYAPSLETSALYGADPMRPSSSSRYAMGHNAAPPIMMPHHPSSSYSSVGGYTAAPPYNVHAALSTSAVPSLHHQHQQVRPYTTALGSARYPTSEASKVLSASHHQQIQQRLNFPSSSSAGGSLNTSANDPAAPHYYNSALASDAAAQKRLQNEVAKTKGQYEAALDRISELESTVGRLQTVANKALGASRGINAASDVDILAATAAMGGGGGIIGGPQSYMAPIGGLPAAYQPNTARGPWY